jgi:hypothetical protein
LERDVKPAKAKAGMPQRAVIEAIEAYRLAMFALRMESSPEIAYLLQ